MSQLADGEWHHLHPLTPLLRGGIAFVAILGIVVVNLRDILLETFFGGPTGSRDEPLVWVAENGLFWVVVLVLVIGLSLFVLGFYFSWRMSTFRITDEVVEVQSGILFKTNRKGRLDRIQGINIVRPFLARIFGAARLEINVAGHDANVRLDYLGSAAADELRVEILRLASGTRGVSAQNAGQDAAQNAGGGGIVEQRVAELLGPELAPGIAPRESVVVMHLGRLIGSIVLSGFTIVLLAVTAVIVWIGSIAPPFFLFAILPGIIGTGSYYLSKFTRSLRYSIAGTPDGVRVGFGLFSTSNETLPPGRIHSVRVSQPLLWRAAGWWEISVNRAANSSAKGAAGNANTTILPVGNLTDVMRVLQLLLPDLTDSDTVELLRRGMVSRGGDDGFTNSPKRAAVLRWFSWRRNGFAVVPGAVLLRTGAIWRHLVVVPQARMQSIELRQGPLLRALSLASVALHTVAGPITAHLGAVDSGTALAFFTEVADAAVRSLTTDTSHRWRTGETA